ADPRLLPRRARERVGSGTRPARGGRLDAGRRAGGRRPAVRYPHAGRSRHRLLRALTTFAPLYVPASLREAVSDEAWLAAMLDAERALARVTGAGVPDGAFLPELYDVDRLCEEGRADASPVVPLARALRERAPGAHQ